MNSGLATLVSKGKILSSRGTHQKFDRTAYRLLAPLIDHRHFPQRKQILKFEGYGGPDGLKMKGNYNTSHLWDPINEIGQLPQFIDSHFQAMIAALKEKDLVRASFDAGWMAHFLTDGLTPAHHLSHKLLAAEYQDSGKLRKNWLYWGRKGLLSSHVAFETGISSSIIFSPIRVKFDQALYQKIKQDGLIKVFKAESRIVAGYDLYNKFLAKGWTTTLAKKSRSVVINRIPQLVAAAWAYAYTEAGYELNFKSSKKQTLA